MRADEALTWAEELHTGQTDKSGSPYFRHVSNVCEMAMELADEPIRELVGVVAALHDVIEDAGITDDDLAKRGVSDEAIEAIEALTKRPGEPYEGLIKRAMSNPIARVVKVADSLDNTDQVTSAAPNAVAAEKLGQKYQSARALLDPDGEMVGALKPGEIRSGLRLVSVGASYRAFNIVSLRETRVLEGSDGQKRGLAGTHRLGVGGYVVNHQVILGE